MMARHHKSAGVLLAGLALPFIAWTSIHASEFGQAVSYSAGNTPHSVAVGDFNGDGIPDLAVADFGSNMVSILIGTGAGAFQQPVSYPVGPYPGSVAVGDFNRDGALDLAVANTNDYQSGGGVSVLLGNGDGTFQAAKNYSAVSGSPFYIAVADLNRDGVLDLAVADHSAGLAVYLGNGDGTFQAGVNYPAGSNPQSVAVGDFNGGGVPDLAVPNKVTDNVSILIGNGNGTFQAPVNYNAGTSPAVVGIGDFNADHNLDLAVANNGSKTISVLLGNGDGTFQAATTLAAGNGPFGLAVADVNGDSKADIVVCDSDSNEVGIYLGVGNGTFQTAATYPAGTQPRIVVVADLNHDGAPDLAVADVSGGVDVLLNNGGTLINTASSLNPSTVGQAVTFTTTVSASIAGNGVPTGTVTFEDGDVPLGTVTLSNGQASLTTSSLTVGTHFINAAYSGDSNFNPNSAPPLSQMVTAAPAVTLSATALTFGTQLLNTTSHPQVVTLTNTGGGTLNITSVATTGDFSQTNDCGSNVPPSGTCTISVAFKPLTINTLTGTVSITDNAPGSPQTISLSGVGTEVKLVPSSLNFGVQKVGTSSAPEAVTLKNVGHTSLTLKSFQLDGSDPGDFSETNTCGSSLPAGNSCTITITFTPTAKGARIAFLSIADNGGGSPQKVSLGGTGK